MLSLICLVVLQSPDILPSGGDDADRLQRLIGSTARAASGRTITLGPGQFSLSHGISVPLGTKNLTIRGSGMGTTILRDATATGIKRLLEIGYEIPINNNWSIRPPIDGGSGKVANTLVAGIKEGDATLRLVNPPSAPGYTKRLEPKRWYLLYDDHECVSYSGKSSLLNHAEPVFVEAISGTAVTLRGPVGRDYSGRDLPKLAHLDSKLCQNIVISDLTIDGANNEESFNIIPVSWTLGFKAERVTIRGFRQNAIYVQDSLNWEVSNCEIYTSSGGETNSGYGIVAGRGSRFGKVHDIKSKLLQGHGYSLVVAHAGGSDMECWNVFAPGAKLDIHGMDSLRITYRDSKVADLHLGNNQWLAAGYGHRAENIVLTSLVWVQAGARDTVLKNIRATGVVLNSQMGDEGGSPANGKPEGVTFFDCAFTDAGKPCLIYGEESGNPYRGSIGKVAFRNCSFENQNSQYGGILVWRDKFEGEMVFEGCTFRSDTSPFFESMIRLKNTKDMGRARLVVENCTFISGNRDTNYAIGLNEWAGELIVRNNTLVTPCSNASVLAPGTNIAGSIVSGNQVRRR